MESNGNDSNVGDGGAEEVTTLTSLDDLLHSGSTITIDDAIETIGMGKFQWRMFLMVGLCVSADATEVVLLSFLSLTLQSEWDLTSTQAATVTASVFAGMIVGTLVLGYLGDHCGRRPIYLTSCAMISVFGLLTAFAPNYGGLLTIRFLVGFGVGGLTVPYDIFAEFLPTECRGKYLTSIWLFWTFGSMLTPIIAYFTLEKSWRVFVVLCAIPCFLSGLFGFFLVPESPRYLIAIGKEEEAMRILRKAATVNGFDPAFLFQGKVLKDEEVETSHFLDLFSPKWRKIFIPLAITWGGFSMCYYGLSILIARLFDPDAADSANTDGSAPDFDYVAILVSYSSEIIGLIFTMVAVDKFGRVRTQVGSYALAGVAVFILSFSAKNGSETLLTIIAFCTRAIEVVGPTVTWMHTAELLTTDIRTTGHSAVNAVARLFTLSSPYIVSTNNSFEVVGIVFLVAHLVTALAAYQLPETKGHYLGHTSEEDEREDSGTMVSGGLEETLLSSDIDKAVPA